jgi:hypothetical protein
MTLPEVVKLSTWQSRSGHSVARVVDHKSASSVEFLPRAWIFLPEGKIFEKRQIRACQVGIEA